MSGFSVREGMKKATLVGFEPTSREGQMLGRFKRSIRESLATGPCIVREGDHKVAGLASDDG